MTLQEKCDAWRERAEGLSNEMDQLKSLLDQLSRDKLAAEEQLAQHLKVHIQILMTITLNVFLIVCFLGSKFEAKTGRECKEGQGTTESPVKDGGEHSFTQS